VIRRDDPVGHGRDKEPDQPVCGDARHHLVPVVAGGGGVGERRSRVEKAVAGDCPRGQRGVHGYGPTVSTAPRAQSSSSTASIDGAISPSGTSYSEARISPASSKVTGSARSSQRTRPGPETESTSDASRGRTRTPSGVPRHSTRVARRYRGAPASSPLQVPAITRHPFDEAVPCEGVEDLADVGLHALLWSVEERA